MRRLILRRSQELESRSQERPGPSDNGRVKMSAQSFRVRSTELAEVRPMPGNLERRAYWGPFRP
jgi:hypothetical protein